MGDNFLSQQIDAWKAVMLLETEICAYSLISHILYPCKPKLDRIEHEISTFIGLMKKLEIFV